MPRIVRMVFMQSSIAGKFTMKICLALNHALREELTFCAKSMSAYICFTWANQETLTAPWQLHGSTWGDVTLELTLVQRHQFCRRVMRFMID